MLLVPTATCLKRVWFGLKSNFIKNVSKRSRVETCGQTDRHDQNICVYFGCILQITRDSTSDVRSGIWCELQHTLEYTPINFERRVAMATL